MTSTGITDNFGLDIKVGDNVRILGWGWNARLDDCGRVTTITGVNRHGTLTHDNPNVANGKPLRGECCGILTDAGGYLGNRTRCTCGARLRLLPLRDLPR